MQLLEHLIILGHLGPADAESGGDVGFGDDVEVDVIDLLVSDTTVVLK